MNFEELREFIRNWFQNEAQDDNFISDRNFVFQNALGITSAHYRGPVVIGAINREFNFNSHDFVEFAFLYNGRTINVIVPFDYITSQEEFISIGKPGGRLEESFEIFKYISIKLNDRHHQIDDASFISDLFRNNKEGDRHFTVREIKQVRENLRARIQALGNIIN